MVALGVLGIFAIRRPAKHLRMKELEGLKNQSVKWFPWKVQKTEIINKEIYFQEFNMLWNCALL